MNDEEKIATIRREYNGQPFYEQQLESDPLRQFKSWFDDVLAKGKETDPTAMLLSTVDNTGYPDSRVLLLKGMEKGGFVFYSNYESAKAIQLKNNPRAALNFFWPSLARQVRVRGEVKRLRQQLSEAYFSSRPRMSQISAIASPQSREIASRESLETLFAQVMAQYDQKEIPCPSNWGGYVLVPQEIEFWQGREDRLHDRMVYFKEGTVWKHRRLAP